MTRRTPPSGEGRGRTLPFAGGISVMSTYSPARMRSASFLGMGGRGWPTYHMLGGRNARRGLSVGEQG